MRVLIVTGEYPPLKGGVGRYTYNLASSLKEKNDIEIIIAVGDHNKISESDSDKNKNIEYKCNLTKSQKYYSTIKICHGIIKKGDPKNSDRLLDLVNKIKPDVVNVQYERGLYENDSSIKNMIRRILHGSTLHKFYYKCPVSVISTLHTVMPKEEYQEYIAERSKRSEGRIAFMPQPIRSEIRKWVLKRRYELLLEIVNISGDIISPAKTIRKIINRGTVIYHGAEPFQSISPSNRLEYRKELGLPLNNKLLLAFGYVGSYKGFDLLNNIKLPDDWSLVIKQNKHERGTEKPVKVAGAINLHLGYIDDLTLSKLFFACDATIFPYRLVSVSGILFDALAHGLPFVASDLSFFTEFSDMGLGITCPRDTIAFSDALRKLAKDYVIYRQKVMEFNSKLRWDIIADKHINLFHLNQQTPSAHPANMV